MSIVDPPAIAGGTDLLQVQLLTFEAKRRSKALPKKSEIAVGCGQYQLR